MQEISIEIVVNFYSFVSLLYKKCSLIQSVFARSPVDEDAPVEVLSPFLDFWTFSNSDIKKEIDSNKPPARTDKMAM